MFVSRLVYQLRSILEPDLSEGSVEPGRDLSRVVGISYKVLTYLTFPPRSNSELTVIRYLGIALHFGVNPVNTSVCEYTHHYFESFVITSRLPVRHHEKPGN